MRPADLAASYRELGEACSHTTLGTFYGLFAAADVEPFEAPHIAGDFELRYPTAVALAVGDVLTIDGAQYRVTADPLRISTAERVARLAAV